MQIHFSSALENLVCYVKTPHVIRNSYSKTDNDAVAMRMKDGITAKPRYNEGIAVENGFVLSYDISDNAVDNVALRI